ncbi:MAG: hypothetical protein HZB42_03430 [Sphingobacteriales bacterium]|nr:hypothetical protein [Sphingobacteriales bacterium]
MKKIFRNNRLIAFAFLTLFSASTAAAATPDSSNGSSQVELKLIGNINNQIIFQLTVAGSAINADYSLAIRDMFGNSIYHDNVKAGNFSKKFLFNMDELGDDTLELEVFNRKTKQTVIYEINRYYKTEQNIAVIR